MLISAIRLGKEVVAMPYGLNEDKCPIKDQGDQTGEDKLRDAEHRTGS